MRIQHNILALNAYRNYQNNTNALGKNLEKLSSGYKINRAGDDAAGLAISEKMRAQITGLEAAQKNVKDGVNLVKTAEGAMQEIQDMLNRMDYIATESANGTYQDPVDRENLQKEVTALKAEINRIADSANFNGIKLLDGSQAGGGAGGSSACSLSTTDVDAVAGDYKISVAANVDATAAEGDTISLNVGFDDDSSINITLTAKKDASGNWGLVDENGKEVFNTGNTTAPSLANAGEGFAAVLKEKIGSTYKVSADTTGNINIVAREGGTSTPAVKSVGYHSNKGGTEKSKEGGLTVNAIAADAFEAVDLSKAAVWDGSEKTLEDSIFDIGGSKFVFIKNGTTITDDLKQMLSKAGVGNNYVVMAAAGTSPAAADVTSMSTKIGAATGLKATQGSVAAGAWTAGNTGTFISLEGSSGGAGGGGLTLQIGDTADSFNQLQVSIGDMHTKGKMGIDGINIGTLKGAQSAITTIKNAINYVSSIRGDLGAIQNRLEHTQNNLSVMQENIQDAESAIRDTDVASEMMAYTKNNILIQSAQAMLAQANAVPQGVLQLLQ